MAVTGEISDPYRDDIRVDKRVVVKVTVEVLAEHGKECFDQLVRSAYDFSLQPSNPPF